MVNIIKKCTSADGSYKFLLKSSECSHMYEALYFSLDKAKDERIICMSSQAGCLMGCKFCSTGKVGHCKNLSAEEMLLSVEKIINEVGSNSIKWVSLMGMGEPLMNYDEIVKFNVLVKEKYGYSMSLSSVGVSDNIKRLADSAADYHLFVSLHFSDDCKRSQYMPINNRYNIASVIEACKYYHNKKNYQKKIEISYMLLEGINDKEEDIEKLIALLDPEIFVVQVLLYNENRDGSNNDFKRVSDEKANLIVESINRRGLEAYLSVSVGRDILGGCGQLTGENV